MERYTTNGCLDLSFCNLEKLTWDSIQAGIAQSPKIEEIDFSYNEVTRTFFSYLKTAITNNRNIRKMSLRHCGIRGDDNNTGQLWGSTIGYLAGAIKQGLHKESKLESLDLSHNPIGGKVSVFGAIECIMGFGHLKEIDLRQCGFTEEEFLGILCMLPYFSEQEVRLEKIYADYQGATTETLKAIEKEYTTACFRYDAAQRCIVRKITDSPTSVSPQSTDSLTTSRSPESQSRNAPIDTEKLQQQLGFLEKQQERAIEMEIQRHEGWEKHEDFGAWLVKVCFDDFDKLQMPFRQRAFESFRRATQANRPFFRPKANRAPKSFDWEHFRKLNQKEKDKLFFELIGGLDALVVEVLLREVNSNLPNLN